MEARAMSRLAVTGLCKRFGGLTVADDVSLALEAGDRVALIGPNGAGKTTLVNLVTGHVRPDAGRVMLDGRDITSASPARRVRAGLARSFQVSRLFSDMTVHEHVALAILRRMGRDGMLFADYRAMPEVMAEIGETLALLALEGVAQRPAGAIAYGQQRLVELAIVLALKPRVLLLDEPAAGLPGADAVLIERALGHLSADLAVLMIEHDMDFVFRFARRVVVLAAGAVIFAGAPEAAAADAGVRQAYLGSYADARLGA
jgi:branched-chain amino acid transport system ATP-binding protein